MNYFDHHQTIVITWPAGLPAVPAPSGHWRREINGDLSVEYTREQLIIAVEFLRQRQADAAPDPQVIRPGFSRLSQRAGRQLAQTQQPGLEGW